MAICASRAFRYSGAPHSSSRTISALTAESFPDFLPDSLLTLLRQVLDQFGEAALPETVGLVDMGEDDLAELAIERRLAGSLQFGTDVLQVILRYVLDKFRQPLIRTTGTEELAPRRPRTPTHSSPEHAPKPLGRHQEALIIQE